MLKRKRLRDPIEGIVDIPDNVARHRCHGAAHVLHRPSMWIKTDVQGVSEKTLFKDFYFLHLCEPLMPVLTIVLVKVVGEMLDDD